MMHLGFGFGFDFCRHRIICKSPSTHLTGKRPHILLSGEQNQRNIDFVEYACLIHVVALKWCQIPPNSNLKKIAISRDTRLRVQLDRQ